jgi:hypothetical protein
MRRVRWSLSGPHRTRSGTPVAVAVKQRGNFAQRSDRDARRHLPSPSDGSPPHSLWGRHRLQLDGNRWVPVQLSVDHAAEHPAQGEVRHPDRRRWQPRRHRHGEPKPQRPGRLQPDVLGQRQAGHHGIGVLVLVRRIPGGSSVTRGPCRTYSTSTRSRRMPRAEADRSGATVRTPDRGTPGTSRRLDSDSKPRTAHP